MFNNKLFNKQSNKKQENKKNNDTDYNYKTIINLLSILISQNKYNEANCIKDIVKEKYSGDPMFIAIASDIELNLKNQKSQLSTHNCSANYDIRSKL